jgi:hypothetical protein
MKPLLISLAMLCAPACVLSQGVVAFRNDNLTSPPNRLVYCGDMTTPLTGTTFAAQLLYGTDPASLQPHPTLAYFREPTTSLPGTWVGGNRTLTGIAAPPGPGTTGPTIWLQVVVWDSGAKRTVTFDQARATGALWTQGAPFSYTQSLSSPPNPTEDTKMQNFVSFSPLSTWPCVPEPTVALLTIPLFGVLWFFRRAKSRPPII